MVLTNKSGTNATFNLYTAIDPEGPIILTFRDAPVALSSYNDPLQLLKDKVPLLKSNRQDAHTQFVPLFQLEPLPLKKICRRVWYPSGVPYPEDDWQQHLTFYPSSGVLAKHQSCTIRVNSLICLIANTFQNELGRFVQ